MTFIHVYHVQFSEDYEATVTMPSRMSVPPQTKWSHSVMVTPEVCECIKILPVKWKLA